MSNEGQLALKGPTLPAHPLLLNEILKVSHCVCRNISRNQIKNAYQCSNKTVDK